ELLELLQRVEDGVMLDRGRQDAMAAHLAGPGGALQGQVERLGPAAGEDDLPRSGAQRRGDLLVRLVEGRPGASPPAVRGAGVPELAAEERQHRLERLGPEGGRGGVV